MTQSDRVTPGAARPGGAYRPADTGNAGVDSVLAVLATVSSLGLEEQVVRYTEAHEVLRQTLGTIESD